MPRVIDPERGEDVGRVLVGAADVEGGPTDEQLRVIGARVYESRDMRMAIQLLAGGQVDVSGLVTRIVPLERAVEDGFEALRSSRSEMKILLQP